MMSQEANDLITRTGPKAPCGKLMRMYWQPAALVDELQGPRPVRRSSCSRKLVLFRDQEGKYGLIDRHCAHRGADLAFGRLENSGLRCAFHGWLFRRERPVYRDARGAEGLAALQRHQATRLSRGGEERYPLGLSRRRRTAGVSRARLFCGARQPYFAFKGHWACQLAAGARKSASIRRTPRSCTASSRTRIHRRRTPMAASSAVRPRAATCR